MASSDVLRAVAVTVELCGANISPAAAAVLADDLSQFPELQVLGALNRCRRELRPGQFNVAAVIERLDDGRPGAEEAWAMIPRDESASVVWTQEMRDGWAVAMPLIRGDEIVPARMAFLEAYRKAILKARETGTPIKWSVSLGHDLRGRELALTEAVSRGRLTKEHALLLLPHVDADAANRLGQTVPALPKPADDPKQEKQANELRSLLKKWARMTPFERVCEAMTPQRLESLVLNCDNRDTARMLNRLHAAGVVSDDGKIVPKEERAALAAKRAQANHLSPSDALVAELPPVEPSFK